MMPIPSQQQRLRRISVVVLALLALVPLLTSCVITDMMEDLPKISDFGDFMQVVLLVGVINVCYNLLIMIFFKVSGTTELIFFILLVAFSPYSFFMSLLIAVAGRILGFLIMMIGSLIIGAFAQKS